MSRPAPEAPVLRRTRRRLIAWSGGSTLVVLLVLGASIYVAAASSLAAAGTAQLRARFDEMRITTATFQAVPGALGGAITVTGDPSQPGVVLGGDLSGTIAIVSAAGSPNDGADPARPEAIPPLPVTSPGAVGAGGTVLLGGLGDILVPDRALVEAAVAAGGGPVIREGTMGSAPVRVLVGTVTGTGGVNGEPVLAVVIGDRTAELDTLRTLLVVLLAGGLAVLVASVAVGNLYAGRALVPIRESLRRQREFAADASHELRTPLAITQAAIAELRRGRADPAVVDRAIEDLDAGATRLASLVDDLLLLARTDAETVELVLTDTDLALAAAEAAEALEPVAAGRGVRLVLDVEPAPVRGDEARLRQLTTILVDNAIRHSPGGGRVTITARAGATLVVDDEGPGIAPEHREAVFERFWRAPGAPADGTGLGLAIARWIADRHGGAVVAEARPGGPGARFVARIPGG